MFESLCTFLVKRGAKIVSLLPETNGTTNTAFTNPSILSEKDGMTVLLRSVNYAMHHNNSTLWNSPYGPVSYDHPDNDPSLRTENYLCRINGDGELDSSTLTRVEYMPYEPKWLFVGEEDARLVGWDGSLSLIGCRRDTDKLGTSRMEISTLDGNRKTEVSRKRMPSTAETYCEKNWMPVLDEPYTFVRTANPLEIVRFDPESGNTETVLTKGATGNIGFLRGSSQVIKAEGKRMALVHETQLWKTPQEERNAVYTHRFIIWDDEWNVERISIPFTFLSFDVEFSCGLAYRDGKLYIPFSVYDNAPFMLIADFGDVMEFIDRKKACKPKAPKDISPLTAIALDNRDPQTLYEIGLDYFTARHYHAAHAFFLRCADVCALDKPDYFKLGYDAFYMVGKCILSIGGRKRKAAGMLPQLIDWDSTRYEAYYELSKLYYGAEDNLGDHNTALAFAKLAMECAARCVLPLTGCICDETETRDEIELQYLVCALRGNRTPAETRKRLERLARHAHRPVAEAAVKLLGAKTDGQARRNSDSYK